MSGHYYRVGVHGPPDPDEHPWVMRRNEYEDGWRDPWEPTENSAGLSWFDGDEWFPIDAPPSELAPEPEDQGVEVDGRRYRLDDDGDLEVYYLSSVGWVLAEYRHGIDSNELAHMGRVAQALGLVDQPPVPRALVDWLREWIKDEPAGSQNRVLDLGTLLAMIEAGEFGPVEGER